MNGPSLSWSKSRHETFLQCKQKYLFQYYDYWNGWRLSAPTKTRRIYYNKNLRSLDTTIGLVVHEVIGDAIRRYTNTGFIPDLTSILKFADQRWTEIAEFTVRRHYRNKKGIAFKEFDDGMGAKELATKIDDSVQKTKLCLQQFYTYFMKEAPAPRDILTVDDGENGFMSETIAGRNLRIYAIIDYAYARGADECVIVDWKTGLLAEEEDTKIQCLTYGIFANNRWGFQPDKIHFKIAKLINGVILDYQYTEAEFEEAIKMIEASVQEMIDFEGVNVPSFTENKDYCAMCSFTSVCEKFVGKQVYGT